MSVFDKFMERITQKGLALYPAQEEAILAVFEGSNVILNTPTGSGKSLVALALHEKALSEGKRSFYSAPIKALVSEKFFDLCRELGAQNVGMMTGDATINRDAPVIACTQEILSQLALSEGATAKVDYAVVDEFHYYSDRDRGAAWQVPLLDLPQTTFLLMSATLGDTDRFASVLTHLNKKPTAIVRSSDRPVPLDFEYRETPLHETIADCMRRGLTPVYLVNFTQRAAAEEAQNLMSTNFLEKAQKQAIAETIGAFRFDTPFGKEMSRFLRHGIGLHHAGLLPKYRLLTEKLAQKGLLAVISGTDTLGVGVNVPIRTVLFSKLCKFDGEKTAILTARDFHQISGRAGRKGFDARGAVMAQAPEHVLENKRIDAKLADNPNKKLVKKKPPEKGYVHWDKNTFDKLIQAEPEPLESQFDVTAGMLLSVVESRGYRPLVELVAKSHARDYDKRLMRKKSAELFRMLRAAGVIDVADKQVVVHDDLQGDFSLRHALDLWLVTTLPALDGQAPDYALDALSLIEATLENPRPILEKQVDKLKTEKIDELKAQGVPYEERIAQLDEVDYPKPKSDFIYDTFNAFRRRHPWLETDNIRPKSIARELHEKYMSFNEYVREYGVGRSEGLLLRYLSDTYRALVKTVPLPLKTEPLEELTTYFMTMLRQVDTSLVEEWERLTAPLVPERAPASQGETPLDLTAVRRRVRSELHRLVKTLAAKIYEDAAEGDWTADALDKALQPYFSEHKRIVTDPYTRTTAHTLFDESVPNRWRVKQILADPEGHNEWHVAVEVDPNDAKDPNRATLIRLINVGT